MNLPRRFSHQVRKRRCAAKFKTKNLFQSIESSLFCLSSNNFHFLLHLRIIDFLASWNFKVSSRKSKSCQTKVNFKFFNKIDPSWSRFGYRDFFFNVKVGIHLSEKNIGTFFKNTIFSRFWKFPLFFVLNRWEKEREISKARKNMVLKVILIFLSL